MTSKFGDGKAKKIDYTIPHGRIPSSWSYTRYGTGKYCLLKYALKFIWKLKEPDNYAMERGTEVHSLAEGYLKGTIQGLPDALHTFETEFKVIRKLGAESEASWTVTKSWQPTTYDDWDNAWLRGKVDIHIMARTHLDTIDIKTGRARDEHEEQAELYGILGFCQYPKAKTIDTEFWYTDSGDVGEFKFKRSQLPAMKKKWRARIKPILAARRFPATPTPEGCKWCSFRSDKKLRNGEAGPCDGWKKL